MRQPALLAAALVVTFGLSGCSPDTPTFITTPPARSATGPAPTATQSPPTSKPSASVDAAGLRAFDAIGRAVVRRNAHATGRAFIDALIAAGYPKSTLQLTPDHTSIGLPAPSVQFSALHAGVCLIGQYGPESGGYHGIATTPIGRHCLIGTTRPITW